MTSNKMNGLSQTQSDEILDDEPVLFKRFVPKISGNKDGRPKGAKGRKSIARQIAFQEFTVSENGKKQKRFAVELVLKFLQQASMEGDYMAGNYLDKLRDIHSPIPEDRQAGYLVVHLPETLEEHRISLARFRKKSAANLEKFKLTIQDMVNNSDNKNLSKLDPP